MSRFVIGYTGAVSSAVAIAVSYKLYICIYVKCIHRLNMLNCSNVRKLVIKENQIKVLLLQVSLSFMIKRANGLSPTVKLLIQKFVPFPAVGKYKR